MLELVACDQFHRSFLDSGYHSLWRELVGKVGVENMYMWWLGSKLAPDVNSFLDHFESIISIGRQ
jgi:hypothetical protein